MSLAAFPADQGAAGEQREWLRMPDEVARHIVDIVMKRVEMGIERTRWAQQTGPSGMCAGKCRSIYPWGCMWEALDIPRSEYAALPVVSRQFLHAFIDYCVPHRTVLEYHHSHPRDLQLQLQRTFRPENSYPKWWYSTVSINLPRSLLRLDGGGGSASKKLAKNLKEVKLSISAEQSKGSAPAVQDLSYAPYESLLQLLDMRALGGESQRHYWSRLARTELTLEKAMIALDKDAQGEWGEFRLEPIIGLDPAALELFFETSPADEPPPRLFFSSSSQSAATSPTRITKLEIKNRVVMTSHDKDVNRCGNWLFPQRQWIELITSILSAYPTLKELHIRLLFFDDEKRRGGSLEEDFVDIYYLAIRAMSERVLEESAINQSATSVKVDFLFSKTTWSGEGSVLQYVHHPLLGMGKHLHGYLHIPKHTYGRAESITREIIVLDDAAENNADSSNSSSATFGTDAHGSTAMAAHAHHSPPPKEGGRRKKKRRAGRKAVVFRIERDDITDDEGEDVELTSDYSSFL